LTAWEASQEALRLIRDVGHDVQFRITAVGEGQAKDVVINAREQAFARREGEVNEEFSHFLRVRLGRLNSRRYG
jgi:hypothetical protein